LAIEQEATQELVRKEAQEAILQGEDKEAAAYHKNLSVEESQALILQNVEKRKRDREQRKKQELESQRSKYEQLRHNRLAPQQITSATVIASYDKKSLKVDIKRKDVGTVQSIPKIKEHDLGITEWIELYQIVSEKKSVGANLLIEMMRNYFDKIARLEQKLGITDSILRITPKQQPTQSVSHKRRKANPPADTQLEGLLINTNLLEGVPVGTHGQVIKTPVLGMFFDTFSSGRRFYRAEDLNLTE